MIRTLIVTPTDLSVAKLARQMLSAPFQLDPTSLIDACDLNKMNLDPNPNLVYNDVVVHRLEFKQVYTPPPNDGDTLTRVLVAFATSPLLAQRVGKPSDTPFQWILASGVPESRTNQRFVISLSASLRAEGPWAFTNEQVIEL